MPDEDDDDDSAGDDMEVLRWQVEEIRHDLHRLKRTTRRLRLQVEALPARMPRSDAEGCLIGCAIPLLLFIAWPRLLPWIEWVWDLFLAVLAAIVSLFRR